MQALVGLGISGIGSLFGAKKASTPQTQTKDSTSTENYSKAGTAESQQQTQQQQAGATLNVEDPALSGFRSGLTSLFGQEYKKAQQPVFGDAQKASYLNSLNDLSAQSMDTLKSHLAGVGALDSGATAQGMSGIEQGRFGQYANFLGQLPFQEEQRRAQVSQNLLGLGLNFAGRGPTQQFTFGNATGAATGKSATSETGTDTKTAHETTVGSAPGFGAQVGAGIGGALGAIGGGVASGDIDLPWAKKK